MEPKIVERPGFFIIGIEVRTNNSDEGLGNGKIGGMWQKFYAEDVLSRIPGKVGADVLAMYTRYESDVTGEYSFILVAEVNSLAAIPEGMVGKETPAAKYAVFTSARGVIPGIIIDVWKRIWDSVGSSRATTRITKFTGARAGIATTRRLRFGVG